MGLFSFSKKQSGIPLQVPTSILPDSVYEASNLELKDVLAPSALQITPRELNLGSQVARMFFVISDPRYLTDNWFSPVINLEQIFDISIFIHPIDTAPMLKKFQKKVTEHRRAKRPSSSCDCYN
jgi:hypothetical protein